MNKRDYNRLNALCRYARKAYERAAEANDLRRATIMHLVMKILDNEVDLERREPEHRDAEIARAEWAGLREAIREKELAP